jgi:hypothetical protein
MTVKSSLQQVKQKRNKKVLLKGHARRELKECEREGDSGWTATSCARDMY